MSDYWGQYLVTFGVMLLIYVTARVSFWYNDRIPRSKYDNLPGSAIDASPLTKRLAQVKDNYVAGSPADRASFKKSLQVEQRREEIARLAYFQKSPEPDEPEKHDGFSLMFV